MGRDHGSEQSRVDDPGTAAVLAMDVMAGGSHRHLNGMGWGEDRLAQARRVRSASPGDPLAHWLAATVYVARGKLQAALEELRAGGSTHDRETAPGRPPAGTSGAPGLHWLYGLVLYALGDEDGALRELSREITFEARGGVEARHASANSWYALGAIHAQAGRASEAQSAFAQALKRVPGHPLAMLYVAPASLLSAPAGVAGVMSGVEATLVMAAYLVLLGQHHESARLCTDALLGEADGAAGWWLPVEPTLRVAAHEDVWASALTALRARAG